MLEARRFNYILPKAVHETAGRFISFLRRDQALARARDEGYRKGIEVSGRTCAHEAANSLGRTTTFVDMLSSNAPAALVELAITGIEEAVRVGRLLEAGMYGPETSDGILEVNKKMTIQEAAEAYENRVH